MGLGLGFTLLLTTVLSGAGAAGVEGLVLVLPLGGGDVGGDDGGDERRPASHYTREKS